MAKRKRDVPVLFWVSAEELELIHQKMQQYGGIKLSTNLRLDIIVEDSVIIEIKSVKEIEAVHHKQLIT